MKRGPGAARRGPGRSSRDAAATASPSLPDPGYVLRNYAPDDEAAALALWLRAWRAAYPQIDFAARLGWWRERWRRELVPSADIIVADAEGDVIGFVTVAPRTRYLDQIAVAPERWQSGVGAALIAAAKARSPRGLDLDVNTDNARAVRFYVRMGFSICGAAVNPLSGRPLHRMSWRP